ncbi:MAG: D-glycero-beta-D-manno-heptose 1-phosphate adenylyltransferase [Armatimonadota bacterium]
MTVRELQSCRAGKTVVFTNGVFDILHAGHVDYLEKARALGDYLVVAVNTDETVRRLKGETRPVNQLEDRMRVIGALRCVDCVVSFSEHTPETIIAEIRPDVHVKGGDYTEDALPEAKVVRSYGGSVVIMPTLEGRSTTRIIERMQK